tara:strand:+ start:145 stop:306 length:162 start_codon:yes stop_codon:yes gene_type:complete
MDLYIKIIDENGDTLRSLNIYMDGSDSEGAKKISDWVLENYEGVSEHEKKENE